MADIAHQVPVRFRRLMREGFREVLASMALAALGTIFIDVYIRHKFALDRAMRDETLKVVGAREEPTDTIQELGLVATALAKVNATPDPAQGECPATQPNCVPSKTSDVAIEAMVGDYVESTYNVVAAAAAKHLSQDGSWIDSHGDLEKLTPQRENSEDLSWPELTDSSLCYVGLDHTFLMMPAQSNPPDTPQLAAAADVSGSLVDVTRLEEFRKKKGYEDLAATLVQAYFISPDSLLRIWNPVRADLCRGRFRFPKTRLWASKNYFRQFWEKKDFGDHLTTRAYIDYGGNGLVRTSCRVVQLRHDPHAAAIAQYPRGHFLGIFCMDFKLPPAQVNLMRHQLFFETLDVTFPIEGELEPDQLIVKAVELRDQGVAAPKAAPTGKSPAQPTDAASAPGASPGASSSTEQQTSLAPEDATLNEAIEMQGNSLDEREVRSVVYQELEKAGEIRRTQEILRISYRGTKDAFLLPLGVSGNQFQALFFYPRSPRLKWYIDLMGIVGFLCAGAAIASLVVYRSFHSQIGELRERMSFLRNLQAGVVKAKQGNELAECNDRAEELCGRRLPKPGVKLDPPINYEEIFELFVMDNEDGSGLKEIELGQIEKLRNSGKASAYFARVRDARPHKWLFVRATPIMEPEQRRLPRPGGVFWLWPRPRPKIWQMIRQGSLVTITDACEDRRQMLEYKFNSREEKP